MVCDLQINQYCKTKNKFDRLNGNLANLISSGINKKKDSQTVYDNTSISISDLRQTDTDILNLFLKNKEENSSTVISFNGLKIRLNLHQEILSRSLKRLRELNLIEKTRSGYRSTIEGKMVFSELVNTNKFESGKNIQIFQVYLPFKILNKKLVENLTGKWFGTLRWIGLTKGITGYQLKWKDIEDLFEISLHISDNNIIVETNDNNPSHMSKAFSYSTKILDRISDIVIRQKLLIFSINNIEFNRIHN